MSIMTSRQAAELDHAFERNGWTSGDVKKISQGDMLTRLLPLIRGSAVISEQPRPWREQDGIIYLTVTSDGTTGPQWIERLEKNSFRLGDYAKSMLRSSEFKPTSGVTTEIAVLKGILFEDKNRITKLIRSEAERRNLTKPNAEVACLIREKFSDKEIEAMDLSWIVAMHEPIKDSGGDPCLLDADRDASGSWLHANLDEPGDKWRRGGGFAFVVSHVSAED